MATIAEHPANMNTCYEPDIDSFLNLDQIAYTSTEPVRPKGLPSQPSVASTDFASSDVRSASFASSSQSPMAFQAPSHQYDEHKQQTGLPPGALAHAMGFNQMNGMGFGAASPGFAMNGDIYGQVKREDPLDFNTVPTRNPSEMDLEGDNIGSVPGYFFSPNQNKNQFVDPNALGSQEAVPVAHSTQVGRMYPGMHQQQAAMAKAAQQQKQNEMLRQQQQQQQQQQQYLYQLQQQQQQQQQQPQQITPPAPTPTFAPPSIARNQTFPYDQSSNTAMPFNGNNYEQQLQVQQQKQQQLAAANSNNPANKPGKLENRAVRMESGVNRFLKKLEKKL